MPPPRNEERPPRGHAASARKDHGDAICREYEPRQARRQVEIARIAKGARAEIRIGISDFSGRPRLFLRQFEMTGARLMRATGKGVVFDASHVQAIVTALQAAASTVTAFGKLPPRAEGPKSEGKNDN